MDISIIDASKTNTEFGIHYGAEDAPKKVIEFVNLACPYSRQWFEESYELLEQAVAQGKAQRVFKLFDKEKESLQRGNVMHRYVTKNDGAQAIKDIKKIYQTQPDWKGLSLAEVAEYAEKILGLKKQEQTEAEEIIEEAAAANIRFVPTVIIGESIFDESISYEELHSLVMDGE